MLPNLKPGDVVICIRANALPLQLGKSYIVIRHSVLVYIKEGGKYGWARDRFKLIPTIIDRIKAAEKWYLN